MKRGSQRVVGDSGHVQGLSARVSLEPLLRQRIMAKIDLFTASALRVSRW